MEHNVSTLSVAQQKSGDLTNDNIEQNVVNSSVTQQKSGDLFNEQNLVDLNATQERSGDLSYDYCSSLAQQLVGEMFQGESRPSADEVILTQTSPLSGVASPVLFSEDVEIPWADRVEEEEDKEHSYFGKIRASRPSRSRSARDGYELVLFWFFLFTISFNLKAVSININGLRDADKRISFLQWLSHLMLPLLRNYQLGFLNMDIYVLDLLARRVRVVLPSCTTLAFRLLLYVPLMAALFLQNLLSVIQFSV